MKYIYFLSLLLYLIPIPIPKSEITPLIFFTDTESKLQCNILEKIHFIDNKETLFASTTVNIRSKPNKNSEKLGILNMNDEIQQLSKGDNGWSKVLYKDKIGYINSSYLVKEKNMELETMSLTNEIIIAEENVSNSYVNTCLKYFNKLPDNAKKFLDSNDVSIYITDSNLSERFFNGQYNGVLGCTLFAEKNIYLSTKKDAIASATIHEVGHIIDYLTGYPSKSEEFQDCYITEKDSFIEVGKKDNNNISSSLEYFAEVLNQAILYPDTCSSSAPNSYNYVLNVLNNL